MATPGTSPPQKKNQQQKQTIKLITYYFKHIVVVVVFLWFFLEKQNKTTVYLFVYGVLFHVYFLKRAMTANDLLFDVFTRTMLSLYAIQKYQKLNFPTAVSFELHNSFDSRLISNKIPSLCNHTS